MVHGTDPNVTTPLWWRVGRPHVGRLSPNRGGRDERQVVSDMGRSEMSLRDGLRVFYVAVETKLLGKMIVTEAESVGSFPVEAQPTLQLRGRMIYLVIHTRTRTAHSYHSYHLVPFCTK